MDDFWSSAAQPADDFWARASEPQATPQEPPGATATFVGKAANATPFGKEAVDALTAAVLHEVKSPGAVSEALHRVETSMPWLRVLNPMHLGQGGGGVKPTETSRAELAALGRKPAEDEAPSFGQEYRADRDARAADLAAGAAAHPIAAGLGQGAGTALSFMAPLPGVKVGGPGLKGAIASGAVNGGIYGGLGGLTGSDALSRGDLAGTLKDTGINALAGAGIGAGLGGAGYGLSRGVAALLGKNATATGRRVLTGGSPPMNAKKSIPPEAVNQALKEGAISVGGTTHGANEKLRALTEDAGQAKGALVNAMSAKGVQGPDPTKVGLDLIQRADSMMQTGGDKTQADIMRKAAEEIGNLQNPSLPDWEKVKGSYQDEAKKYYDFLRKQETPESLAHKAVAGHVNDAIEGAIQQQADLAPQEAAAFAGAKRRYGNLIKAFEAAERGSARQEMRSPIGLATKIAAGVGLMGEGGLAAMDPKAALGAATLAAAGWAGTKFGPSTLASLAYHGGNALQRAPGKTLPKVAGAQLNRLLSDYLRRGEQQPDADTAARVAALRGR